MFSPNGLRPLREEFAFLSPTGYSTAHTGSFQPSLEHTCSPARSEADIVDEVNAAARLQTRPYPDWHMNLEGCLRRTGLNRVGRLSDIRSEIATSPETFFQTKWNSSLPNHMFSPLPETV
jgi:hypothetical protein